MKEYVFTSPPIHYKAGSWALVFRQTADGETNFGLIAKHIGADITKVVAHIEIIARIGEQDIIPESDTLQFVHKFECDGDCGFSPRIPINYEQLRGHKLEIMCRTYFTTEEVSRSCKEMRARDEANRRQGQSEFENPLVKSLKNFFGLHAKIFGNGSIFPENKFESERSAGLASSALDEIEPECDFRSFMKHPEIKVFYWKIPDFSKRLKNVEFEELPSAQIVFNSNGFCSIWRLQLIELNGIFRLHLQLRELPRGISQIKMHYLLELEDNFVGYIPISHYGNTWKNPGFLHLWDTQRVTLYSRETILERFVLSDRSLSIRISLHCAPNNIVKISDESGENTDWILHN